MASLPIPAWDRPRRPSTGGTPCADPPFPSPVGTVRVGPTFTYTAGGATHTIAHGDPTQIYLSPGVVNEAAPSALAADGQSFNDCADAQSCPAP